MSLPRRAIRRPVATMMFFAALCGWGIFAYIRLPVDLLPNAGAPTLTVFIGVRGGLPPEDIENLVTKPVEEAVSTTSHLREMLSVSRKERATVTLTFEPGTDVSFAALDVQERLARIKNKLPKDIEKPVVAHYGENDYPVVIFSLTSDDENIKPEHMRELADNVIKPKLTRVSGVANVEIGGGRERKILVEFSQPRLEAHALSIRQVIETINRNNDNLLAGKLTQGSYATAVRAMGQFRTLEDIKTLIVLRTQAGAVVRLEDIADVKDFYLEATSNARLNRKPTVSIYVQKESNSNTIRVAERVLAVMEELKKESIPPAVNTLVVTDQSVFIREAMNSVVQNLTIGALLTWLIIFFFLRDAAHTSLVFLSVPVALLMTLGAMWVSGITLNALTLSALALSIGMVVDTSTVVLENVLERKRRALRRGEGDLVEITIQSTDELYVSLIGSTITTVVVFLPIVFINKQVRILYSGLAVTITYAMLSALLVSVTLIPFLSTRLRPPTHVGYLSDGQRRSWDLLRAFWETATPGWLRRWFPTLRALVLIAAACALGSRWVPEGYAWVLWVWGGLIALAEVFFRERFRRTLRFGGTLVTRRRWSRDLHAHWTEQWRPFLSEEWARLRAHPRRAYRHWCGETIRHQKKIFLAAVVGFILSLGIYVYRLDKDFLGTAEANEFVIFVELPAGAKLDISDQVVADVEKILSETPEISDVVKTAAARVEGWSSKIYVTLNAQRDRSRSVQSIIEDLRPQVAEIGSQYDTFIYFSEPESAKEFLIDVFGPEYDKLRDLAVAIANKLQNVRGFADVKLRYKPGRPEKQVVVDKAQAALVGLTIKDIAETLHAFLRGLRAGWKYQENTQLEIIARLQEKDRKTIEDVQFLSILTPDGYAIPLAQLADLNDTLTPSEVWRKDKQRVIQVSASREHLALSKAAEKTHRALRDLAVPAGYYFQIGGDYVDMVQNEREFRFAFIIMALLVFIVLASLFESYSRAILIMATIPMSLMGSIPLLWITGTAATMSVFIGLIMLGGIVVAAAIIQVERIHQLREAGRPLKRAVLEGASARLKPILNTSLTTIIVLVPMAVVRSESSQLWAPLALTVIGGAGVATFLTLFLIPALYYHMENFKIRWKEGRVRIPFFSDSQ